MEIKHTCLVHHFRYVGNRCPICENERVQNMISKHEKKEKVLANKKENVAEYTVNYTETKDFGVFLKHLL